MVGRARPARLRGAQLRLGCAQRCELRVSLRLALAGRAVEWDVRRRVQRHVGGRVAVVVHPEAAVVAPRHVLVRRQPHLRERSMLFTFECVHGIWYLRPLMYVLVSYRRSTPLSAQRAFV